MAAIAGLALLAPSGSWAQNPMTLKDCINAALGESPELEIARLEATAADEDIKSAQGVYYPYLKGRIHSELFSGRPMGPFALQNAFDPEQVGPLAPPPGAARKRKDNTVDFGQVWVSEAVLTYPLFKDGSIMGLTDSPAVASAKARKQALSWTKNLTREEIIYSVSEAYLSAAASAQKLRLDERAAKMGAKRLEIVKSQVAQGLKVEEDVKLAESQVRVTEFGLQSSRQQTSAALAHLAPIIGVSDPAQVQVDTTSPAPSKLPPLEDFAEAAMQEHPSISSQRSTIEQARQNYLLARSQRWPTVNMEASAAVGDDFDNAPDHLYRGAIIVEVPIFDFGQRGAAARASRDRYRAEEARLALVTKDLRRTILDAYNAILTAEQALLVRQAEIQQSQGALKRLQTEQEQGKAAPLAAVEAEIALIEKEKLLHEERFRQLLQYATLQKLAGGSWQWLP